ncbi:MAG: FAD-dependent oxidoreductase [Nocardioides sp.]
MTGIGRRRIVVCGGGYAGVAAARAIQRRLPDAELVLVDARPAFFHHVAALRATVRPAWASRLWMSRERLVHAHGSAVHARVRAVDDGGVTLTDGGRIDSDAVVVATGSVPAPIAQPVDDDPGASVREFHLRAEAIARARSVLVLGAGPVGLELAGEVKAAHPALVVAVSDPGSTVVPGPVGDRFRGRLRGELERLGIALHLETTVRLPGRHGAALARPFDGEASVLDGEALTADVVLVAFGRVPAPPVVTADALTEKGWIRVDRTLRVAGYTRVFAIGDATDLPEQKLVVTAQRHAGIVARNLDAVLTGGPPRHEWAPLRRALMIVPIGDNGGAAQLPLPGEPVFGRRVARAIKGRTLLVDRYRTLLGGAAV